MVFFHFRFCSSSLEDRLLENLYQQRLLRLSIRFRRDAAMVALHGAIVLLFVLKSIVLAVLRCREQLPQLGASLDPFSLNETVPNPVIRSRILSICLTLPPPMPPWGSLEGQLTLSRIYCTSVNCPVKEMSYYCNFLFSSCRRLITEPILTANSLLPS